MPDLSDGDILGARARIEHVWISNFHLPLRIKTKEGSTIEVECSIIGTVSLEGHKKGINMSRIIRVFYEFRENIFDIDEFTKILTEYRERLGSYEATILISFRYRMWQESLRSVDEGEKNGGWQYYNIGIEVSIDAEGLIRKIVHFDFVYSSACPCSYELSKHAFASRDKGGISHSQRSVARISLLLNTTELFWFEDIQALCRKQLQTETLVFCKREDEQAFAELNAAYPKFVEDAVRLLYEGFDEVARDFRIVASHNESLHSHDAIALITKGDFFHTSLSIYEQRSLVY